MSNLQLYVGIHFTLVAEIKSYPKSAELQQEAKLQHHFVEFVLMTDSAASMIRKVTSSYLGKAIATCIKCDGFKIVQKHHTAPTPEFSGEKCFQTMALIMPNWKGESSN